MAFYIDKVLLFLSCLLYLFISYPKIDLNCTAAFLTAVCVSCICSYITLWDYGMEKRLKQSRRLRYLLFLGYLLLCLTEPAFCYFLPLIFYDMALLAPPWLLTVPVAFLVSIKNGTGISLLILLIFMVFSYLLSQRSRENRELQERLKRLRDSSTEYNLLLAHKNRDLMEKQDYEIYLATLKERNRIAREIHDNVGHLLSRSLLQVGALQAINQSDALKKPLTSLRDTLSGAMDSIRSSVHDLHDDSVDLKSAVDELLKDFQQFHISYDYDMGRNVPRNIKYCLISILKEGLSNIAKHSTGDSIHLVLREHPSIYQLLLEDNGKPLPPKTRGIGLENMKERVQTLQGTFSVSTEDGFRIFVTIPVQEGDI